MKPHNQEDLLCLTFYLTSFVLAVPLDSRHDNNKVAFEHLVDDFVMG